MIWTVGQQVIVVSNRGRDVRIEDGEIVKIGRKWLTVKTGQWAETRFDLNTGRCWQDWGYPPRLYPSREAYEAETRKRREWDRLRMVLRDAHQPPEHLDAEQIAEVIALLSRPAPTGDQSHGG